VFRLNSWTAGWITTTLQTITPNLRDFRQVKIRVPYCLALLSDGVDVRQTVGEANCEQWLGLDRLLIQLWESRAVRPQVVWATADCAACLLPEAMKSGIVELVNA
jgi:hypothetical protein